MPVLICKLKLNQHIYPNMTIHNTLWAMVLVAATLLAPSSHSSVVVHNSTQETFKVRLVMADDDQSCEECKKCGSPLTKWTDAVGQWTTRVEYNEFRGIGSESAPVILGVDILAGDKIYRIYRNPDCGAGSGSFVHNEEQRTATFVEANWVRIE